jgi:endonuclease/exonuclease/phosphatase family metal-dependent hydrolase
MKIAEMIREKIDSITGPYSCEGKIIILGDFNSTPDDQEIKTIVNHSDSGNFLVNLSEKLATGDLGTYRYMGIWEMIDQVIVTETLLNCSTGLYSEIKMLSIFRPGFLLVKDPKYPGLTPFSTYRGYRYQGGFSDHLPVLLDLKLH